MTQLSILTAIELPGVTTIPSPKCLQWSGDGQAVLLARTAIYILTPQLGINIESPTFIKRSLDKDTKGDTRRTVQWLRTMIEWDKDSALHHWPTDCQDWSAVSLGSLDPQVRSVACSPHNLTLDAGCVLAVLDSNMQVSLWATTNNRLTGVWDRVGEYEMETPLAPLTGTDSGLYRSLQAQVTSIAWSTQAESMHSPAPIMDLSLLALGSRAGTVCLARYSSNSPSKHGLRRIALFNVGDRWVTHLAWSSWTTSQSGQCEALLACGISDGSVCVVKVTQSLDELPEYTGFIKDYEASVTYEVLRDVACATTNKGITSLQWIQTSKTNPFLVFSTSGQLHIWSSAVYGSASDSSSRVINLRTVQSSVGSTSLALLSGISYVQRHDVLVVSLADGSFHTVCRFSTYPELVHSNIEDGFSAEALSNVSRSVFIKLEERRVDRMDVNRIGAMIPFDDMSAYAWIQEAARPTSFDYKHDAKHSSTFVVARLWHESHDDALLDDITRLTTVNITPGQSPIASLRPVFLNLQDPATITRLYPRIVHILKNTSTAGPLTYSLASWSSELNSQFRSAFRTSLVAHLFNAKELHFQRLRMSIAGFCQVHASNDEQQQFGLLYREISNAVGIEVLRTLIRHIRASVDMISNIEMPLVLRIVVQALLPGTSADLGLEAREMSAKVNKVVPDNYDLSRLGPEELCPACQAPVPFQNAHSGVCPNGHTWARCSITSFLLATPMVRTCIGCGRKALLPPPRDASGANWLPIELRNWVAEDFLDAVRRCLFCANAFVTLL